MFDRDKDVGLKRYIAAALIGINPFSVCRRNFADYSARIEEFDVDGVNMVFQNTPNTEAPREMNTYIPDMKALWMAENVIASLHNIYTLRGAPVRDPLNWS